MTKFFKSFYYAFEGIKTGSDQRNFKIHILIALLVLVFGLVLSLSIVEWLAIIISISIVIAAELFNSSVESICDLLNAKLKLEYHDTWDPRNLAAGAVLITAIGAAFVGLLVFIPKIFALL